MNRLKIISIIIIGYGITIYYRKSEVDHNQKSKKYNSDGSVKKFRVIWNISEWNDWQMSVRFFYNYSITFRLNMNR